MGGAYHHRQAVRNEREPELREIAELRASRDELLAALQSVCNYMAGRIDWCNPAEAPIFEAAQAAIARATGN